MNGLAKYLVEAVLDTKQEEVTVLLPGGFKPPHIGHLNLVMAYFGLPNVSKVVVLVGPGTRDNITREDSIRMWNLMLRDVPDVEVRPSKSNSPLTAAYEYVQEARPGTYALAASSKGEDYARVSKFVNDHEPNGKYYRDGIHVVELEASTKPIKYINRIDNYNSKPVSATVLRKDIASGNYKNFATNYQGLPNDIIKSLYSIVRKKPLREVISEGGGAGHLAHPYEDISLTFDDVANMIDAALAGKLELAQEKLDGQNLMVSYKNGNIVAARNKGQLKNYGQNALSVEQMKKQFSNRGEIQVAFVEAMNDLEAAVGKLSPQQKEEIFQSGRNFISLEVLYPGTANVIPYGAAQLRLHHVKSYDENGNVVDETQEPVKALQTALDQQKASNQKTYQIRATDPATIDPDRDYKAKKQEYLKSLEDIKGRYKLEGSDRIAKYFYKWWKDYVNQNAKNYKYKVPKEVMIALVKRWAFGDKSTSIKKILNNIDNTDFASWTRQFDQSGINDQRKIAGRPIELLFLKVGVRVLKNLQNLVTLSPEDSIRKIKRDVAAAINQIKSAAESPDFGDGELALKFLKRELQRVRDIGGFDAIVPTEGIVFTYKGKLYKLTGLFAPINQILGYLKY